MRCHYGRQVHYFRHTLRYLISKTSLKKIIFKQLLSQPFFIPLFMSRSCYSFSIQVGVTVIGTVQPMSQN